MCKKTPKHFNTPKWLFFLFVFCSALNGSWRQQPKTEENKETSAAGLKVGKIMQIHDKNTLLSGSRNAQSHVAAESDENIE